jgi:hypothetical protein
VTARKSAEIRGNPRETAPTDTTKRLRELTPRAEALLGRIERELVGVEADWLDEFEEDLAAALSAAREEERKRWEDHANSYFDGWEDGEGFPLADTFIAALSPEGRTEGGE